MLSHEFHICEIDDFDEKQHMFVFFSLKFERNFWWKRN